MEGLADVAVVEVVIELCWDASSSCHVTCVMPSQCVVLEPRRPGNTDDSSLDPI